MKDEDIKKVIPQRDPILMVDQLVNVNKEGATTCFMIQEENFFLNEKGQMAESGVIEHIAQSASAFAGYKAIAAGASEPPIGYIGEIKNFHCYRCPQIGETLCTTITIGTELNGITILTGETYASNELIADTRMKIFVK